jgi:hypothetical protein
LFGDREMLFTIEYELDVNRIVSGVGGVTVLFETVKKFGMSVSCNSLKGKSLGDVNAQSVDGNSFGNFWVIVNSRIAAFSLSFSARHSHK